MRMAFGEWRPDTAELDQGVCAVARNVFPGGSSYRPIPGPAAYSDALPDTARGLWMVQTIAGDFQVFAGTDGTLQKLVSAAWTEVGTGYDVPEDENWSGVQFGSDVFVTNINDGLQVFDIESGSSFSAVGGASPDARHIEVVESYLMAGGIAGDSRAIAWSDTEDGTTWSGGNSGGQAFKDGGAITNICGAAKLIVQEYALRSIVYDPGGDIFQFEKIEQAKGSIAPQSVVKFGASVAYLAEDGFWFNGKPIGQDRVNRHFFANANQDRIFSTLGRVDPLRPIFWWLYRSSDADAYDKALLYNWQADRWAEVVDVAFQFASSAATPGLTMDTLPYATLEEIPYSLDSRVWLGGRPVFAVIDEDGKLAFLEGNPLEATIETGERQLIAGYRARVRGAMPLVDATGAVMRVRGRERQGDSGVWSAEASQQASGICRFNEGARYHRFRVRVPEGASWTHAQGIEIPDTEISRLGLR